MEHSPMMLVALLLAISCFMVRCDHGPPFMFGQFMPWTSEIRSVEINCDEPSIQNIIQQDIEAIFNNDGLIFSKKSTELCSLLDKSDYATWKASIEASICFERSMDQQLRQRDLGYCSTEYTVQEINDCVSNMGPGLDFWHRHFDPNMPPSMFQGFQCFVDTKKSYCQMARDSTLAEEHERQLRNMFLSRATCADLGSGRVVQEFQRLLANPLSYIRNMRQMTLENILLWTGCGPSTSAQDFVSVADCENTVTEEERQIMERSRQVSWWGPPSYNNGYDVETEKYRLLNEAKENNDLRKFMCLTHYKSSNMNYPFGASWIQDALREFMDTKREELRWDEINVPLAEEITRNIEVGNYEEIPNRRDLDKYVLSGACKSIYDRYTSTSTMCSTVDLQTLVRQVMNTGSHFMGGSPTELVANLKRILRENNGNSQLALCLLRELTEYQHGVPYWGPYNVGNLRMKYSIFCDRLSAFVQERKLDAIYQTPDCSQAVTRIAGVDPRTLGEAIVNRNFATMDELVASRKIIDADDDHRFDACLFDDVWTRLTANCQGQYAVRVNDIRSYVQQINSDVTVRPELKQKFKLGKVMQGNNKGNDMGRLCDVYAVVGGSTTESDKAERTKLLKMALESVLKGIKEQEAVETLDTWVCPRQNGYFDMRPYGERDIGLPFGVDVHQVNHFGGGHWIGPFNLFDPQRCGSNTDMMFRDQVCNRKNACDQVISISEQTCTDMTSLKSTVDTEWETIMNNEATGSTTNTIFDFYTSLMTMARNIRNTMNQMNQNTQNPGSYQPSYHPYPPLYQQRSQQTQQQAGCAVKLFARKLQDYWTPVDQCFAIFVAKVILSASGQGSIFMPQIPNIHIPPMPAMPPVNFPSMPEMPPVNIPPMPAMPPWNFPPMPEMPAMPPVNFPPMPEMPPVNIPPMPAIPWDGFGNPPMPGPPPPGNNDGTLYLQNGQPDSPCPTNGCPQPPPQQPVYHNAG